MMNETQMRERIMARLRKPFSYEPIVGMRMSGGLQVPHTSYRISDANDDAVAHTSEECYAIMIVVALNK